MAKRTRSRLLYLFIFLFLIAGPAIVLYASGWRIDLANFRVVKVGGIFLKDLPSDATIQLDNKSAKNQVRKLLTGTLIAGLLPGTYNVKIQLDGYQDWEADLPVQPAIVTETRPIILIPSQEPNILLKKPVANFWVNDEALVYESRNGTFYLAQVDDLENRTNLSLLFDDLKGRLLNFPGHVPIVEVLPQSSSNIWLVKTAKTSYLLDIKRLSLKLQDTETPTASAPATEKELILADLKNRVRLPGVIKYDYDDRRLYMLTDKGIVYFDLSL